MSSITDSTLEKYSLSTYMIIGIILNTIERNLWENIYFKGFIMLYFLVLTVLSVHRIYKVNKIEDPELKKTKINIILGLTTVIALTMAVLLGLTLFY